MQLNSRLHPILFVVLLAGALVFAVCFQNSGAFAAQAPAGSSTVNGLAGCTGQDCIKSNGDPAIKDNCNKGNCDLVTTYLNPAITLLSAIVGVAAVISIIIGGIQYSSAGGDPQKVAAAKGRITKTVIAVLAYIFFYAFMQWIVPGGILHAGT